MANPARMTSRLTIQRLAQTVAAGVVTSTWADVKTCAAKIEWQAATETLASDQLTVARTVTGHVRYMPELADITERDRILWNDLTFSINAWLPYPATRSDIINFTATACP